MIYIIYHGIRTGVEKMDSLNFSFKTVQNYMYEYNRKKRGDKL